MTVQAIWLAAATIDGRTGVEVTARSRTLFNRLWGSQAVGNLLPGPQRKRSSCEKNVEDVTDDLRANFPASPCNVKVTCESGCQISSIDSKAAPALGDAADYMISERFNDAQVELLKHNG